jgi:hypothetical protein
VEDKQEQIRNWIEEIRFREETRELRERCIEALGENWKEKAETAVAALQILAEGGTPEKAELDTAVEVMETLSIQSLLIVEEILNREPTLPEYWKE